MNGLHSALPSCFLSSDVGGGERKVGGFWFPKTRMEWSGVEWSGGEEKKRGFPKRWRCTARVF